MDRTLITLTNNTVVVEGNFTKIFDKLEDNATGWITLRRLRKNADGIGYVLDRPILLNVDHVVSVIGH